MRRIHKGHEPTELKQFKADCKQRGVIAKYEDGNDCLTNEKETFLKVRTSLLTEQHFTCAYCGKHIRAVTNENGIPLMKTEHFLPKKADKNQYADAESWASKQLTYHNLLACCMGNSEQGNKNQTHCDSSKGDIPLLYIINPADKRFSSFVSYKVYHHDKKVKVYVKSTQVNAENKEDELNKVLNLNENYLAMARYAMWKMKIEKELGEQKKWKIEKVKELLVYYQTQPHFSFQDMLVTLLSEWITTYAT